MCTVLKLQLQPHYSFELLVFPNSLQTTAWVMKLKIYDIGRKNHLKAKTLDPVNICCNLNTQPYVNNVLRNAGNCPVVCLVLKCQ